MKIKVRSISIGILYPAVSLILSLFLMIGCAPQAQVGMLERQVSGLLRENQRLNNEISLLKAKMQRLEGMNYDGGALAQLRKRQATLDNRLAAVQADMLRLSGHIDMLQHEETDAVPVAGLGTGEGRGINATSSSVEMAFSGSTVNNQKGEKNAGPGKKTVETPPVAVDLYESGLELLKQGNFMEAKQTFKNFVEKNPESPRVANACFWSGECEYRMGRFEEAILEYQKVISRYPSSNKVPDALLKQGMAFLKLGDRESARIVLEKLLKKYPKSPQALTADKQLKRIR